MTVFEYNTVKNAIKNHILAKDIYKERDFSIYFDNLHLEKQTTKAISKFIKQRKNTNIQQTPVFWRNLYGDNLDENQWLLAKSITNETKLIVLQWKILHNIYPTNVLLLKMNIKQSDKCDFCLNERDTLIHYFYACTRIKPIWRKVEQDIHVLSGKNIVISEKQVMLGIYDATFETNTLKMINKYVLLAKRCIILYKIKLLTDVVTVYEREKCWRNEYHIK